MLEAISEENSKYSIMPSFTDTKIYNTLESTIQASINLAQKKIKRFPETRQQIKEKLKSNGK